MSSDNDIRHGRHCVFLMHVHLVFVTKYRRGVFTKEILDDLRGIFASVCADFEAERVEFDGEEDHVHLLVNYPPKVAVSALVMVSIVVKVFEATITSVVSGFSPRSVSATSVPIRTGPAITSTSPATAACPRTT